jgi:hypothetical protein
MATVSLVLRPAVDLSFRILPSSPGPSAKYISSLPSLTLASHRRRGDSQQNYGGMIRPAPDFGQAAPPDFTGWSNGQAGNRPFVNQNHSGRACPTQMVKWTSDRQVIAG